jgi:hypothetical protein
MAQSNPFSDLLNLSKKSTIDMRTNGADAWFKERVDELYGNSKMPFKRVSQGLKTNTMGNRVGKMYTFRYLPIGRDKLPYYDTFPLIMVLDFKKDSILGINLHYLPHKQRAILFGRLLDIRTNSKFDKTTRIKMTYDILKGYSRFRFFKPCIKRYKTNRIRTKFLFIEPKDWYTALFLPTESFKKAGKRRVWTESINKIKKGSP